QASGERGGAARLRRPRATGGATPHPEGAEEGTTRARAAEVSCLATRPRRAGAAAGEIKSALAVASQSQLICCQPRAWPGGPSGSYRSFVKKDGLPIGCCLRSRYCVKFAPRSSGARCPSTLNEHALTTSTLRHFDLLVGLARAAVLR